MTADAELGGPDGPKAELGGGTILRSHSARFRDVLVLCGLAVFVILLVDPIDALTAPPELVDDNQIFKLDREIREQGFLDASSNHFADRFERLGRFVPAYLAYKLIAAKLFGGNLALWAAAGLAIGIAGAFVLYLAGRAMQLTTLEAVYFSLIVVLGEQSVIWWRLLHGEGIGMLFLASGLFCLARGAFAIRHRILWDSAAGLCVVLATLSKESFILTVPAVCALRVWLETQSGRSVGHALYRNRLLGFTLIAVALAEAVFIAVFIQNDTFQYTGWHGFDIKDFAATTLEFFSGYRLWVLVVPGLLVAIVATAARTLVPGADRAVEGLRLQAIGLGTVSMLFILPQLLLYMSSGFSGAERFDMGRYLVPATLGIALAAAHMLRVLRWTTPALFSSSPTVEFGDRIYKAAHFAIVIPLLLQAVIAEVAADRFFDRKEEVGDLLGAIADNTDSDDVILLAYTQDSAHDVRRLSILLQGHSGRENLCYILVREDGSHATKGINWFELDVFAIEIEEHTVKDPAALDDIAAFVVLHANELEFAAIAQNSHWFDVRKYRRVFTERGHVAYLKNTAAPGLARR